MIISGNEKTPACFYEKTFQISEFCLILRHSFMRKPKGWAHAEADKAEAAAWEILL